MRIFPHDRSDPAEFLKDQETFGILVRTMSTFDTNADAAGVVPEPRIAIATSWLAAPPPDQERTLSVRTVVVCAIFALLLLAAGTLIGVRMATEAAGNEASGATGIGRVLYTLPGGAECRHVLFDNTSAEVSEGKTVPCEGIGREPISAAQRSAAAQRDIHRGVR
jgi:hypothetical protein